MGGFQGINGSLAAANLFILDGQKQNQFGNLKDFTDKKGLGTTQGPCSAHVKVSVSRCGSTKYLWNKPDLLFLTSTITEADGLIA